MGLLIVMAMVWMERSRIGKPCGDEQETYAECEGCKRFRKSENSHFGLLGGLSAVSICEAGYRFTLKVSTHDCLSMQRCTTSSSPFREGKIPVVFSILLDQGIDGVPEYSQTAFSNLCGFQAIFLDPPIDGPSADI